MRDQKNQAKKKSISVIPECSSEAGERYQNALPYPHNKAGTISIAEGLRVKTLIIPGLLTSEVSGF